MTQKVISGVEIDRFRRFAKTIHEMAKEGCEPCLYCGEKSGIIHASSELSARHSEYTSDGRVDHFICEYCGGLWRSALYIIPLPSLSFPIWNKDDEYTEKDKSFMRRCICEFLDKKKEIEFMRRNPFGLIEAGEGEVSPDFVDLMFKRMESKEQPLDLEINNEERKRFLCFDDIYYSGLLNHLLKKLNND